MFEKRAPSFLIWQACGIFLCLPVHSLCCCSPLPIVTLQPDQGPRRELRRDVPTETRSSQTLPCFGFLTDCSCAILQFSNTSVTIAPADFSSWHDARAQLMAESKTGLKARVEAELAAAADDDDLALLKTKFASEERAIEHTVDHTVHSFSAAIDIEFNFLSSGK